MSSSADVLIESVSRHTDKIKQFVEMDYDVSVTSASSVALTAVNVLKSSVDEISEPDIGELQMIKLDEANAEKTNFQSEFATKSEEVLKQENSSCNSAVKSLNESETDSDQNGYKKLLQLNTEIDAKKEQGQFESNLGSLDKSAVNSASVKSVNEIDFRESCSEIGIVESSNRHLDYMADQKEINCDTVNIVPHSTQEEVETDVISDKQMNEDPESSATACSFKTLPAVKIARNEKEQRDHVHGILQNGMNMVRSSDNFDDKASSSDSPKRTENHQNSQDLNLDRSLPQCTKNDLNTNSNSDKQLIFGLEEQPPPDEDTICGFGGYKPEWMQKYATSKSYLVLYSVIGIVQGTYYAYLIACMSTLEKRFAFKTKISGAIMVVDEITPLFLGVLVGYFGGKAHRPRIVALGMFLNVISCFLMVVPYAVYGPAGNLDSLVGQNKTEEVCGSDLKRDACSTDDRPPTLAAVLILALSSFVKGFGNLAYYAVGLAYLDDNSKKKNTAFYLGIAFALRIFGPTLGYLMSSAFLKIHENPYEDPGYGPEDPRWIGGWWMGFLVQGVVLFIFTIPMAFFPRRLPNQRPLPKSNYDDDETWSQKLKGLVLAVKRLSKNPLFLVLCFTTVMTINGNYGHYIMLPKYMENQFRLTASQASLYSGPPALFAIQVATVIGGFCIWKLRPSARFLTAGLVVSEFIGAFGFLILMIPKCEKVELSNFGIGVDGLNLVNQCNAACMCSTSAFTPICRPAGRTTYFSPCHAGCTEVETLNQTKLFNNCSCVVDDSGNYETANALQKGYCFEENCWSQAQAYMIILPLLHFVTSLLRVAHTMIFLRSIAPQDKSVALGAFETIICLFGFIPYPVMFGALVDSACLVWEKSCGQTGNCWFYDTEKFNYMLHGVSGVFSLMSALGVVAIYFLRNRLHDLYEEEEPEEDVVLEKRETIKDSASNATAVSAL